MLLKRRNLAWHGPYVPHFIGLPFVFWHKLRYNKNLPPASAEAVLKGQETFYYFFSGPIKISAVAFVL